MTDASAKPPYYVEQENHGCTGCGAGQSWCIVAPDGVALGHFFDKAQDAHDQAELLNAAYEHGVVARSERTFSDREAILKREERERADKKQDGATTVWGPELQNRPGGPIYRLGTSTGVTLPPQPERVTNTREEPSKAVLEWAQSLLNACQHQKRNDHPNGFAFWAAWPTWEGMAKAVLARSSTAQVEPVKHMDMDESTISHAAWLEADDRTKGWYSIPLYPHPPIARSASSQWIPVAERLPENTNNVIAFYMNEYGKGRRVRAFYARQYQFEDDSDDGLEGAEEHNGTMYVPAGWYETNESCEYFYSIVDGQVTHWTPMPNAPVPDSRRSE